MYVCPSTSPWTLSAPCYPCFPCLSISVMVSARIFSSFKYVELLERDMKVTFTNSFHRRVEEPSWQVSGSGWTRGVEDIWPFSVITKLVMVAVHHTSCAIVSTTSGGGTKRLTGLIEGKGDNDEAPATHRHPMSKVFRCRSGIPYVTGLLPQIR